MIGRSLAANPDVFSPRLAGGYGHCERGLDSIVALVKDVRHERRVAVEAQYELRHVIRTDRHAVEILQVLVGEQGIGGKFGHHDDLQIILTAFESVARHQVDDVTGLLHRAHKRDHDLYVLQAHVVSDFADCRTFHLEAWPETVGDIACGAAETQHRVLFVRLVFVAPDQVGVFIGLEVRHAHDNRFGCKRCGDRRYAFGQPVNEETDGVVIACHLLVDGLARRFVE